MRRGMVAALLLVATASFSVAAATAEAEPSPEPATPLCPVDLRVIGGEDAWRAENVFMLEWAQPAMSDRGLPITAASYRVRDNAGAVVVPEIEVKRSTSQFTVQVPRRPGAYTVEVGLKGPRGRCGPPASATLRFDEARPGMARPLAPTGWIAPSAVLRIEHPAGPPPISGIRGYAVSVDRGSGSVPCARRSWCDLTEIDLLGGIGDDGFSLAALPEGASVVRVLAVSGSGMSSEEIGSAVVKVDATHPAVTLSGAPAGWASGPVRLTATATDALAGMAAGGPSGPFTAIAVDGGVPRTDRGSSTAATVIGEGVHEVAFYARDAAGNSGEESPSRLPVRIDASPPAIAFARVQDPAEPERIEATVADALSGPDLARGSIAMRRAGSRLAWESLPTAAAAGRLVARWDSDSSPPGTYEFRATAYDAAGNVARTDRRGNGTRMVLANPLKTRTALTAGFGGRKLLWQRCVRKDGQRRCRREAIDSFERRPAARAVPYGHGISYAGRLAATAGTRLDGLEIEIVETFATGADVPRRTTTIRTADGGIFGIRLAPGPSRRIEAVFAGTRTLARAGGGAVDLRVLASVRMHASSASARVGGAPVVFGGRVGDLGAPIPPGGRPVELQFRLPDGDWSEFRTVQTDARGRFRYPYAFSDDDSRGIRFQFRAFVPAQDGWPYEPAASRPVFVTGR